MMQVKSLILQLALCLILAVTAAGHAIFALANRYSVVWGGSVDAPVFDAQGVPLVGSNYLAEVWGASTPDSLAPLLTLGDQERVFATFRNNGYFFSIVDDLGVPSAPFGGWAWLQVRAWDARLGATYEAVVVRGLGGYGESPIFYAQGGGISPNGNLVAPLVGMQSFRLQPATAVLIRAIWRQADQVVIEWDPGFKRYQLQQTVVLGQPWQNVGETTTATSITNSISGDTQFFRVIGLLE